VSRLVLETAIGRVLELLLGKLRAARWDSAGATAEGMQDPAPDRAAGQGLATSRWRASAQRNSGEPGLTLARRGSWGGLRPAACGLGRTPWGPLRMSQLLPGMSRSETRINSASPRAT